MKDKSKIPPGIYCYNEEGKCPYWKLIKGDGPVSERLAYCEYLGMDDKDIEKRNGFSSLLWDQIKECNERMNNDI